jgi:hypothetical protein
MMRFVTHAADARNAAARNCADFTPLAMVNVRPNPERT